MPNPSLSDVHVNAALTNVSTAYQNANQSYVASRVFPPVAVDKQSNFYYRYAKKDWFRSEAQLRAPGTESAGGGYRVDSDTYFAHVYAIHKDIDRQIEANADGAFNLDRDATEWVTNQLMLKKEKVWVANYFTTGVWGTDMTGVASGPTGNQFVKWDVAGSTPLEDIRAQMLAIQGVTGYRPNTLVLGAQVWSRLVDHAEFVGRIGVNQTRIVTEDLIATLLGLDNIYVAGAIEVTTVEEASADTYAFLLGKAALLLYVPPNPGLLQPSSGYTFNWTGYLGGAPQGTAIGTIDMPWLRARRVEGELAMDMKLVASDLGTYFTAAVS